jgi:hypothetical protein
MHRPRLSQDLASLLDACPADGGLTVNDLLAHTGERGMYLVMIVLSLPFITPVSLPGLSSVLGLVITLIAARLALGFPTGLPRWIGNRHLPHRAFERTVRGSLHLVRFIEWGVKPRGSEWLKWRGARCGNGCVLAILGLLLALPIPPVIPLSNTLPSYAIILIAACLMEEDGVMIWAGYMLFALAVGYLGLLAGVVLTFVLHHYEQWLPVWFFP